MSTESNQTINQLKAASNIAIFVASGSNVDSVAAGIALKEFLQKQDKKVEIISPSPLLHRLEFLPNAQTLKLAENLSKNLVIEVGLGKTQLSELSYQKVDDQLSIFLTPKVGDFASNDVVVRPSVYPYDLVITLGVANLDELGKVHALHAQLFFEVPVVNIDHRSANENYGRINLVALTSSAVCEVVYDLLNEYDANFIDDNTATLLLAGLIAQTNSFQSQKTTPQVFTKASKLIDLGARQQEIITRLYKSKSLGLLRLWGRVLARLKQGSGSQLVYSVASASDIERSEATPTDLDEIIFEMMQQLSFAKVFVLLAESGNQTICYVASNSSVSLAGILTSYNVTALDTQIYKFTIPKSVVDAEAELIIPIEKQLQNA